MRSKKLVCYVLALSLFAKAPLMAFSLSGIKDLNSKVIRFIKEKTSNFKQKVKNIKAQDVKRKAPYIIAAASAIAAIPVLGTFLYKSMFKKDEVPELDAEITDIDKGALDDIVTDIEGELANAPMSLNKTLIIASSSIIAAIIAAYLLALNYPDEAMDGIDPDAADETETVGETETETAIENTPEGDVTSVNVDDSELEYSPLNLEATPEKETVGETEETIVEIALRQAQDNRSETEETKVKIEEDGSDEDSGEESDGEDLEYESEGETDTEESALRRTQDDTDDYESDTFFDKKNPKMREKLKKIKEDEIQELEDKNAVKTTEKAQKELGEKKGITFEDDSDEEEGEIEKTVEISATEHSVKSIVKDIENPKKQEDKKKDTAVKKTGKALALAKKFENFQEKNKKESTSTTENNSPTEEELTENIEKLLDGRPSELSEKEVQQLEVQKQ